MKNSKIVTLFLIVLMTLLTATQTAAIYGQTEKVVPRHAQALDLLEEHFTFMITSDLGRNGYYDQKPVAEMMGVVASIAEPEFVAVLGDIHHFLGVRSVHDPLWETNFEWIYKHPELMIPWHPVLGNHEYLGTTQAVLDYATISRRWEMPARYYTLTWPVNEKSNVEAVIKQPKLETALSSLLEQLRQNAVIVVKGREME